MKKLRWLLLLLPIFAVLIYFSGLPSSKPLRFQQSFQLSKLDSIISDNYLIENIPLPDDYDGPVKATLISHQAVNPSRQAVLFIHGFADYFFHDHLARWYNERGYNFYALDLRKYGRSLSAAQKPNYCRKMEEYFPEIDESIRRITQRDSNQTLIMNCHSTGGLTASLYAHKGKYRQKIDGMVLNSPFLSFNADGATMNAIKFYGFLGRFNRNAVLPVGGSPLYGYTIHKKFKGDFDFNFAWKPEVGFPFYQSWVNAILKGHQEVNRGLDIKCPVLVLCSDHTYRGQELNDTAMRSDVVLDVVGIRRQALKLGKEVKIGVVKGAVHDVFLSQQDARQSAFQQMENWLKNLTTQ
jgi:alpha-beta hydrolase superfamily lysophospholipase